MKTLSEQEYKAQLEVQRHMYAWCLQNIGSYSTNEAILKAQEFYKHEPVSEKHRNLVFHEDAWHWAMLFLYGEQYWVTKPESENESIEYSHEYESYIHKHTKTT